MKIVDKTPFRSETGEIDIIGRLRGTLKYGLTWYNRLQAQDVVIAVLEKVLGNGYVLLRNITLPDTEIDLPLVLVGPAGVFMINVTHERGVYRARDDEWGTVSGENFVPAAINQISRTSQMGRVLQVYLDRAGFSGMLVVDPILMAADPGMHIDSTRPVVRIVMSDALERFAISLSQGHAIFTAEDAAVIARTILVGPKKKAPASAAAPTATSNAASHPSSSASASVDPFAFGSAVSLSGNAVSGNAVSGNTVPGNTVLGNTVSGNTISGNTISSSEPQAPISNPRGFLFDDELLATQALSPEKYNSNSAQQAIASTSDQAATAPARQATQRASAAPRKGFIGLTSRQLIFLGILLLFWLCLVAGFGVFIYFKTFNG